MFKVLVVEDEVMLVELIRECLEKKGEVEVDAAYTLKESMEMFGPGYDAVILDIMLSDGTCFPLLERIKREEPYMPVIIFSGRSEDEYIEKAKELGADWFIPKPFRIEFMRDFLLPKIESIRERKKRGKRE